MRILVVSDTHGDLRTLMKAVNAQPSAEIIVHCGDGDEQVQYLKDTIKDKMIVGVRGNCDWCSNLLSKEILNVCGKKIFITHGHLYNAKVGLYTIMSAAREEKADILLFGHTHNAMTYYEDGLYVMNPGSCSGYMASYGYIDITEKGEIVTNTVAIK
ncbi:metallophosphoesterase [uncultured Ruminococcus sp.]|jgi:putative phosphoesterase|uniref:metallophosphoesterase n=1 Tax=uncultured Ruminococcus sp. TaxID=165186 RepID=UPI0025D8FE48|nr:metallophosphoesterase [uncultured Ruminococcus sp.]